MRSGGLPTLDKTTLSTLERALPFAPHPSAHTDKPTIIINNPNIHFHTRRGNAAWVLDRQLKNLNQTQFGGSPYMTRGHTEEFKPNKTKYTPIRAQQTIPTLQKPSKGFRTKKQQEVRSNITIINVIGRDHNPECEPTQTHSSARPSKIGQRGCDSIATAASTAASSSTLTPSIAAAIQTFCRNTRVGFQPPLRAIKEKKHISINDSESEKEVDIDQITQNNEELNSGNNSPMDQNNEETIIPNRANPASCRSCSYDYSRRGPNARSINRIDQQLLDETEKYFGVMRFPQTMESLDIRISQIEPPTRRKESQTTAKNKSICRFLGKDEFSFESSQIAQKIGSFRKNMFELKQSEAN